MNRNFIVLLLVLIFFSIACEEQDSSELWVVSGKIIELSENVYGIDGVCKEVGKVISISKKVKYKISWLPQAVKEYVHREPDAEHRYFYKIIEKGNDRDWTTTIEIVTD